MKKLYIFKLLLLFLVPFSVFAQVQKAQTLQVGNTSTATMNSSAALQIDATNRGFLPPRMGLSQITAIANPVEGLMVYCTDCSPKTTLSFDGINWVNANGQQPITITPPALTTDVTATTGVASATVAFTAPTSNSGGAIVGYTVISFPGGIQATGTSSPIIINGLTAGTSYTFTVRATNVSGLTSTSASSNSVTPTASVPGAVTAVTATTGTGTTASVAFTAPANNGGAVITNYTVTSNPGAITATGTTSPITISGLSLGTSYTFTVVATNAQGGVSTASTASNSIAIAATAPNAPTIGTATITGNTASVAFTAPANTGGAAITDYTVIPSPATTPAIFTGTSSPISVPGLSAGINYSFKVTATNSAGTSAASAASNFVQAAGAPSAPTGLVATAVSGTSASVSFTAANSNGSAVTTYTVTPSPATTPATFTASTSPITVTGLTTGTNYTFSVTATNAVGTSTAGTVSYTPQNSVPTPPSGVLATAANASASINFTAPSSDGGASITGYTVTSSPGGITASGTTSPITVNGLTNDTAYTFTVVATNSVGNSVASSPSNPVTPAGAPTPVLTTNNITSVAAFSLRKLYSTYSGPAIKVRRSSDNTEQDIPFTESGSIDTAALTTFVGAENGFVSIWYDQSGAGNNAVQATAANQPTIVSSGSITTLNGKPSILSANSAAYLQVNTGSILGGTALLPENHVQAVAALSASVGHSIISNDQEGRYGHGVGIGPSGAYFAMFNNNFYAGAAGSFPFNSLAVVSTSWSTTNGKKAWVNGAQVWSDATNDIGNGGNLSGLAYLFVQMPNVSPTANKYISEIFVTKNAIPNYVRSVVEADQASYYALTLAQTVALPSPPTNVAAVAGNGTASISFTTSVGATSYTVTSSPGGLISTGNTSPIQVSGLTNGTAYTFTVVATNANGNSSASSVSNSVIPSSGAGQQTVAGAPTIGTAVAGNASASVAFTAPANNGNSTITGYTVTSNPGGIAVTGTTSPISVSGLTVGTSYTFSVVATNSVGNSFSSAASNAVIPFGVPTNPVIGTITTFGLAASIPVTVANNGSAITSYTTTVNPGNLVFNSATAAVTVNLPTAGNYSVTVTATNSAGTSAISPAVSFTVAAITSPQLASNISLADSNGTSFAAINGITAATVISVGGTCPSSITWQGITYPTVNIGGQCWTARNSKATPTVSGLSYSFYLGAADETSVQEGLYYTWDAAMNGSTSERAQGVCPTGWHIPSTAEINYLIYSTGLNVSSINTNIGSSISGATNWMNSLMKTGTFPNATNYTGFSITNGGYRSEGNVWTGNFGNDPNVSSSALWSSSQTDAYNAVRAAFVDVNNSLIVGRNKLRWFSVRCLKD